MMTKNKIKVLKKKVFDDMLNNFDKYSHLYKKINTEERLQFFEDNSVDTGLTFEMPVLTADKNKADDTKDAINIYKKLELSLYQASNMRIWAYLCGTAFYEYIYNILGSDKVESGMFNKSHKKVDDGIQSEEAFLKAPTTAFLPPESSKKNNYRSVVINYISRLWWAAYMCEDNGDFSLISVLHPIPGKISLTRQYFDNKKVAHAIFKATNKYYINDDNGKFSNRDIFDVALKRANVISSSRALDVIPEKILEDEIYKKTKNLLSQE